MVSVVSPLVWVITVVVLLAIMVLDLTVIARRQQTVTTKDAVRWVLVYIGLAAAFAAEPVLSSCPVCGPGVRCRLHHRIHSLSVDNLFVFMIIMARFSVPALAQDKVLTSGSCCRWCSAPSSSSPEPRRSPQRVGCSTSSAGSGLPPIQLAPRTPTRAGISQQRGAAVPSAGSSPISED